MSFFSSYINEVPIRDHLLDLNVRFDTRSEFHSCKVGIIGSGCSQNPRHAHPGVQSACVYRNNLKESGGPKIYIYSVI